MGEEREKVGDGLGQQLCAAATKPPLSSVQNGEKQTKEEILSGRRRKYTHRRLEQEEKRIGNQLPLTLDHRTNTPVIPS